MSRIEILQQQSRGRARERTDAPRERSRTRDPSSVSPSQSVRVNTRSRSQAREPLPGGVFPVDRMERLKREYGTKTVEALYAEFDKLEIEEEAFDVPDHYIETVYDTVREVSYPIVEGSRGGRYFYDHDGQKKYINAKKKTEMIDPDDSAILDLNPALKIQEVTLKKR